MAGVGFQLNKLFKQKGVFANIKAYLYSTLVTIGPTVLCVVIITGLNLILKKQGVALSEVELLQGTIMYAFIFSLLLTSGYCIVLSRYLADQLYLKRYEDILPSLYGALALIIAIGGGIGIVFYGRSPLHNVYKGLAYILFIQLIIQAILGCYTSALKNYKKISFAFGLGLLAGTILYVCVSLMTKENLVYWCLLSFNLAFLIINILLLYEIQSYFGSKSRAYFGFLRYFRSCKSIFLSNVFWVGGLYIHNFIIWNVPDMQVVVGGTYLSAPQYDIPAFYAFLTVLPSLVIFVVKLETAFFVKYSNYFRFINDGACYEDIQLAKEAMKKVLYKEMLYMMQMQLLFTIGAVVIGIEWLPLIGFTTDMIYLFNILSLGYYCSILMFVTMTILLYFEDRLGACLSTGIFFIMNGLGTFVTIFVGETYYGIGLFIAGFGALMFALLRLRYFLKNIDYFIFCKYASWAK